LKSEQERVCSPPPAPLPVQVFQSLHCQFGVQAAACWVGCWFDIVGTADCVVGAAVVLRVEAALRAGAAVGFVVLPMVAVEFAGDAAKWP